MPSLRTAVITQFTNCPTSEVYHSIAVYRISAEPQCPPLGVRVPWSKYLDFAQQPVSSLEASAPKPWESQARHGSQERQEPGGDRAALVPSERLPEHICSLWSVFHCAISPSPTIIRRATSSTSCILREGSCFLGSLLEVLSCPKLPSKT